MPDSLPRWLPFVLMFGLPLSATAQRSYNNWVNPSNGLPAPEAPKPEPVPKPQPTPAPAYRQLDSVGGKAVYVYAERRPCFVGGVVGFEQYIRKHLKRPPGGPRRSGTVTVRCLILSSGAVTNVRVEPGEGLDPRYDAAAVDFVQGLPKGSFVGGMRAGEPMDFEVPLPIQFR